MHFIETQIIENTKYWNVKYQKYKISKIKNIEKQNIKNSDNRLINNLKNALIRKIIIIQFLLTGQVIFSDHRDIKIIKKKKHK